VNTVWSAGSVYILFSGLLAAFLCVMQCQLRRTSMHSFPLEFGSMLPCPGFPFLKTVLLGEWYLPRFKYILTQLGLQERLFVPLTLATIPSWED
jgi:hypothetical protein